MLDRGDKPSDAFCLLQSISAVDQRLDSLPGIGLSTGDAFPLRALSCQFDVPNTGSASLYLIPMLPHS